MNIACRTICLSGKPNPFSKTVFILGFVFAFAMGNVVDAQEQSTKQQTVVLTTYLTAPTRVASALKVADQEKLDIRFVTMEQTSSESLLEAMKDAKLLLIDAPHTSVEKSLAEKFSEPILSSDIPYVWIGELDAVTQNETANAGSLPAQRSVDPVLARVIREYLRFGGKRNTQSLVELLKRDAFEEVGALESLKEAERQPEKGFYHPDWQNIESDLGKFTKNSLPKQNGVVAIAINRAVLTADDTAWLDLLIAELRSRNIASYAFYGPRQDSELAYQMTRVKDGEPDSSVNLVINAALVFRPNEMKAQLDRIGVPVLQAIPSLAMSAEAWRLSPAGLAFEDISYYYTSSELAGMIDPMLITARDPASGSLQPVAAQVRALADKAAATIRLQQSSVASRRVAIMVYNYPLGEGNFGASFLNVPESLKNILQAMHQSGYEVADISVEQLIEKVKLALATFYDEEALKKQLADGQAEFLPLDVYESWFRNLPLATQERIERYWGAPAATALHAGDSTQSGFAIPVVRLGNVSVLAQPPRHEISSGVDEDVRKKRIGHRSNVPLSHTYLATYLWIRERWKADAVVHLGTHGTVEWAPGKERGLAMDDDPNLALGSLPNIYPYIMDNLGEALTAKRRGRAIIVSHLTPMFTPAGFRPGLHEMHDWMHDWELAAPGALRDQIEKTLIAAFIEHRLDKDLGWSPDRIANEFEAFMEVLHPYLDDIAQAAQPQGLAVFGEAPDTDRRLGMVMQILRKPLIEALGEDIDEVFLLDYEKVINSRPARWLRLAVRDAQAASQLDLRQIDALSTTSHTSVPNRAQDKPIDSVSLLAIAKRAQSLDKTLSQNTELASLLDALAGKHISSSYGGDPVRNPESLPTGRNLYGFDPARIPTQQAWKIGQGVLDDWLIQYRAEHNDKLPRKIAYSLWAGETMRHQGVMESQVLYALGTRPVWDANGRVTGVETIPASELNRDRIDVLLSVTGSYRDQFPLVMQWIDQAVRDVAALPEPGNAVAVAKEKMLRELIAEGVAEADAAQMATARVFSNEAGVYGTGLNDAVNASDLWKSQAVHGGDEEMAQLFVDRMGFAFGVREPASKLFAKQLADVDAAFASRSSNTYGMLTSDDPFAYIGGLSLAARVFSNHTPELYVQNLRDEGEVIVDPAARAIAKEMQSRYLHPQWIKSQMAEGYSGTLQVLKTTQFLWGWQVTAPETIRSDQWDSLFEVYVQDKYKLGTMDWLQRDNQAALAQMMERMLDAIRLGYWPADDATQEAIMKAYEESKRASEMKESHAGVESFVSANRQAASSTAAEVKADLNAKASDTVASNPASDTTEFTPASDMATNVRGIELKPQLDEAPAGSVSGSTLTPVTRWFGLAAVVGLVLYGMVRQQRRLTRRSDDRP